MSSRFEDFFKNNDRAIETSLPEQITHHVTLKMCNISKIQLAVWRRDTCRFAGSSETSVQMLWKTVNIRLKNFSMHYLLNGNGTWKTAQTGFA